MSQVSRIPGDMTDRWSKARRFEHAWALLRALRPAAALATRSVPLSGAQGAFEALDAGEALAVLIDYSADRSVGEEKVAAGEAV